ncbi:MAG: GNAT family N-acetyltransferase [Bacteroidetes bacterium]|nr:MAG: GNAT family N-acetyltransferase [Bacteroidota bacterium]
MKKAIGKVELRYLELSDYPALKEAMQEAYSSWEDAYWKEHHLQKLLDIFPEGQVGVFVDGKLVGAALSIIVDYKAFDEDHTYLEITGNYTFDTHNPKGDVLYGIDVFIRTDYRGLRLGRRLYDYRKELCERLNLRGIVFGGRLPQFHKYADKLTPREYIQKVRQKKIHDPVLNFQLANDFHVKKILKGYLPADKESQEYAALLEWVNIYYTKPKKRPISEKTVVRLGLVQWQMRSYSNLDELFTQVEFFVDAVSSYRCDFALFPEFFNAPLMANFSHLSEPQAIRELAHYTDEIRHRFRELAISYNINIITGSMPGLEDERLLNVGFLCRRDGTVERYCKLHVTPDEAKVWGMMGGDRLQAFNTDCGKVGVLICYDVEFPELGRLLAEEGINILFVPFLTDTQNGYSRVRNCAQARAVENECYVAIAGCVGNLPKVENMDIQFSQSVVFTPCDFAFPTNGIKAEATPNTEMILIADVDLDLLKELHQFGSVRNLKDRRTDLYSLRWKNKSTNHEPASVVKKSADQ